MCQLCKVGFMVSVERDESYDALPRVIRARNVETALKYRIQETI